MFDIEDIRQYGVALSVFADNGTVWLQSATVQRSPVHNIRIGFGRHFAFQYLRFEQGEHFGEEVIGRVPDVFLEVDIAKNAGLRPACQQEVLSEVFPHGSVIGIVLLLDSSYFVGGIGVAKVAGLVETLIKSFGKGVCQYLWIIRNRIGGVGLATAKAEDEHEQNDKVIPVIIIGYFCAHRGINFFP